MSEALKPCPFCGGRAISHRNPGLAQWAVSCTRCDCKPLNHCARTEAEAITAWNTRTTDPEIARLQDLVAKFQRGGVSTLFAEGETTPLA